VPIRAPIPTELTPVLIPLREAVSPADVAEAYLYNTEKAGICFVAYDVLVKNIRGREATEVPPP
jgi:hypothetical protein